MPTLNAAEFYQEQDREKWQGAFRKDSPAAYNPAIESGGMAMPVHDWTRVDDGTFHAFHTLWISDNMKALNAGLLPEGCYALAEQVATRRGRHLVIRHVTGHQ